MIGADYGYEWCSVCNKATVWRWQNDSGECTEHEQAEVAWSPNGYYGFEEPNL